jgi:hypothetical protein
VRTTLFLLALPLALHADDLAEARKAHAKELARLRDDLVAAFDAEIRRQKDGAPLNYLVAEKKAFERNGTTPLLPQMQPAARAYLDGKRKADEQLAKALEAAGEREEARRVRGGDDPPGKAAAVKAADVDSRAALGRFLGGTVWAWPRGGEVQFHPDGSVGHSAWKGIEVRWEAVDRRTVVLVIVKGRDQSRVAALTFAEDLAHLGGVDFDAARLGPGARKRP